MVTQRDRNVRIKFQVYWFLVSFILCITICLPLTLLAAVPAGTTPGKKPAQGGRVVVGVGTWGVENPLAWHQQVGDKRLWDHIYNALVDRDPDTAAHRPGLATEWKPSKDHKTWTFKLRPGVQFHEGWGELTAEDVKFTVEQHRKPGATGAGVFWVKQTEEKP